MNHLVPQQTPSQRRIYHSQSCYQPDQIVFLPCPDYTSLDIVANLKGYSFKACRGAAKFMHAVKEQTMDVESGAQTSEAAGTIASSMACVGLSMQKESRQ